jgi:membrane protease YdiL (CAAX protease family)
MNALPEAITQRSDSLPEAAATAHPAPIPMDRLLLVLLGFPLGSLVVSLPLLARDEIAAAGFEFRLLYWPLVVAWYCVQILVLSRVLKSCGWRWTDIGYGLGRRRTAWLIGGYLAFAFALVGFVEFALAGSGIGPEQLKALSDFSNLGPQSLGERLVYVAMGLVAGLCEELVYRGFAINGLRSRGWNAWLTVPVAAIPFVFQHGLKSLDQFWWFLGWGLLFGAVFVVLRKLYANIVVHWLVILSATLAVLQVLR